MKKLLLTLLCVGLAFGTTVAQVHPSQPANNASAQKMPDKMTKGLFTVAKMGNDWYFLVPDSLIGRKFLTTTRYISTPAGCGKFGGEQVNQQTVYFEKVGKEKIQLRVDLLVNTADSTDAINRAILISNENPIIASFKIEGHPRGGYKINVTRLFSEDNSSLGLPNSVKGQFGLTGMYPDLSYIDDIKTYPMNTEVKLTRTWMCSNTSLPAAYATGRATFGLNISFVLLPKVPMQRRYFDPRVGYFTDDFVYFSDGQQRVQNKRFITRWRLEPRDSDIVKMKRGELVEPKKPIIFYIDPATPKQWRKYLIDGVNDWQKAFEQAGFKNAIMGKEWPEKDSTMSMEDARYSVIRYLAAPIENAYGPQVHDPRSGEIIESHICWYHNVMTLVHDWYMVQAGSVDSAARSMKFSEELMGQLIRFVSSHEVGHTLGLRHNFGSSSTVPVDSLRNKAWVELHGHTPSIMDYARFNYVAQPEDNIGHAGIFPRINDYDKWAIQWGYSPMWNAYDDESDHWEMEKLISEKLKNNPRLWFGDGETNNVNDPRCQTEDLGDDAVKASRYGILNLKRELTALPEWTYESNDIYSANINSMYGQIRNQFIRYMNHVMRQLGGIYNNYKTVDQGGAVYTEVSKEKQVYALDFIDEQVFHEPTWFRTVSYADRINSEPQTLTSGIGYSIVKNMASSPVIDRLNTQYPASEYLKDMVSRIFSELTSNATVSPYRKVLQQSLVAGLTDYFSGASVYREARAAVLQTLRSLRSRMAATTVVDASTRAHYSSLVDAIDRALVVK